jgi:hypothetical protein
MVLDNNFLYPDYEKPIKYVIDKNTYELIVFDLDSNGDPSQPLLILESSDVYLTLSFEKYGYVFERFI